jgi:hypothetical protein
VTARDRTVLIVVVVLAALGAFWFLVLGPKRDDATTIDAKVTAAQQRLTTAQASVSGSESARRGYAGDYAAVTRLGKAVPVDDDTPSLLYQLQSVAQRSKVSFNQFEVTSSGAPATTSAPAGGTVSALPPGATVGTAGFPIMPFAFSFQGSYFDLERMLSRLDRFVDVTGKKVAVSGRLLTIDGLALVPTGTDLSKITATVSSTAYLLPDDEGLTAGANANSPAGAGSATPSTAAANLVTGDSR